MEKEYIKLSKEDEYTPDEVKELNIPFPPISHQQMNIPFMHSKGYFGKGVKIAIIDSGCDVENPLIKDRVIYKYNLTDDGGSQDVTDYIGHGTHVAGIVGSSLFKNKFIGVAPECELMIIKVVDKYGLADYSNISMGIRAAYQKGANIINISLTGKNEAPAIHEAIKEAVRSNCLVVCANGNSGDGDDKTEEISFPGSYLESVCVGSIGDDFNISKFSNSNRFIDCVANGENILSLHLNNTFKVKTGSSQSSPLICGALALLREWYIKEYNKPPTSEELYNLLISNAKKLDVDNSSQGKGYIYLNPHIE